MNFQRITSKFHILFLLIKTLSCIIGLRKDLYKSNDMFTLLLQLLTVKNGRKGEEVC